jgi:tetratricopeptide (TPR) repeat protein
LYMSPEQITGDPNAVDHRTDIYSLGATMYEWLTLSPPYPGDTRERVISKILSTEPRPLRSENPAVPLDLETICLKAIERDPNRRYQSAGEMREDLRRYLLSRPIVARRISTATRGLRFIGRHQIAALLIMAFVAGSVLLLALLSKERRVKVEQAEAVRAKAEVVEAKDEVAEKDFLLRAMLNTVFPGGGAIAAKVAGSEFPGASLPTETLSNFTLRIGTPSEIAVRAVETFYSSVKATNWPDDKKVSEDQIALIDQARGRWAEGDAKGAQVLISQYIAALPAANADVEALQMRAALYAVLGQFDAMLADAESLLSAGTPTGYAWRGLARLLLNQARPSLRDFDDAKIGGQQLLWVKVFQGLALLQSEQSAEAKSIFVEILKDPPTYLGLGVTAHLGHAIALHKEEDYGKALSEVEEVLKSDPKNIQALTLRGECRAAMGDLEGALSDFKQAIEIAGNLPELLARYLYVMNARDTLKNANTSPIEGEVKSRHGAEQEEPTAPPVFKWLRQRMPENESGAMQPQSSLLHLNKFRFPIP